MNDVTSEELMRRYQAGDESAFAEIDRRHRRALHQFINRIVGDRAVAEDLVQEAMLRVVKSAPSYSTRAAFTTWLYTIARNLCLDHVRRRVHRSHPSLDAPITSAPRGGVGASAVWRDIVPSTDPTPEKRVLRAEIDSRVQGAFACLGAEQREVFLLRMLLGLSYRSIAEIVDVSENTAKSRMRYALEKLRAELREHAR